jgi:hypothetical protein
MVSAGLLQTIASVAWRSCSGQLARASVVADAVAPGMPELASAFVALRSSAKDEAARPFVANVIADMDSAG